MRAPFRLLDPLPGTVLACIAAAVLPLHAGEAWYPSRYGAEDRLGALNLLTAEKVLEAADLIRSGRTYALGGVTGRATPAYGFRFYDITVLQTGNGTGTPRGENAVTSNDDVLHSWLGIGSQLDGLGHLGIDHRYYNGVHADDFVTAAGLTQFGIHTLPPMVTRGVLLDMARHFGVERLEAGFAFNREAIEAAALAQDVILSEGDVVLFHTGWGALAASDPERFLAGEPGLGVDGAEYLAELGVVAVGSDGWALEVLPGEAPAQLFPVHQTLLARNGVYILESMQTAALAADRAWEFMFVLGQPRFEGAVQVVVNPVAIR